MVKVKSFSIVEELIVEYRGAEYVLSTREEQKEFRRMMISEENFHILKSKDSYLLAHLSALLHLKSDFIQEKLL